MPEKMGKINSNSEICTVSIDRVQLLARTGTKQIPHIPGFEVCRDSFVRPQTAIRTYDRVRKLENPETGTTIYAQSWPAPPWLEPFKLTVVGNDSTGLQRAELEAGCRQFRWTRLLTVELAIDFWEASEVDRSFVLRHGLFGRSRLVGGRLYKDLRYGTRHSDTMVRAYKKPEIHSYRVELELHAAWLLRFGLTQPRDLSKLPQLLCFSRIRFVAIDWDALRDHLRRKGHPASVLNGVQSQARSIHRVLNLLRSEFGLANVHRFLSPLPINTEIKRQLEKWANRWRNFLVTSR